MLIYRLSLRAGMSELYKLRSVGVEYQILVALRRCCVSKSCVSFASPDVVAINLVMVSDMLVCVTAVYSQCQIPCSC